MDACTRFLRRGTCLPTGLAALIPTPGRRDAAEVAAAVGAIDERAQVVPHSERELWRIAVGRSTVSCGFVPDPEMSLQLFGDELGPDDVAAGADARIAVWVSGTLARPAVRSFHDHLRLVHVAAPDAIAVFDLGLGLWRSRSWLHGVAQSAVPPGPRSLYTIHAVPADPEDPGSVVWLHTHGLNRCGSIELEMLDVPAPESGVMAELIDATAAILLEEGVPPAGEEIDVGREFGFAWLSWEHALQQTPPRGSGGHADRDALHRGASGVLVVPRGRRLGIGRPRWQPAVQCLERVDGELLIRMPEGEARRRAAIATERFPVFRDLVARFGADPDWRFLAELGYTVDGDAECDVAEGGDDERPSEHMWFEVHAIDGAQLDATLLDAPLRIRRMTAGARGWHAVDQLSAWAVISPQGVFEPDRIDALLSRVGGRRRRRGAPRRPDGGRR